MDQRFDIAKGGVFGAFGQFGVFGRGEIALKAVQQAVEDLALAFVDRLLVDLLPELGLL